MTLATAAAVALLLAPAAFGDELAEAKAAGYVGEQTDGLLGLVTDDAPAGVKDLVKSVNAKRKEHWKTIAKKEGLTVEVVAKLFAEKAIEKTAPGHYVRNASGDWVKK